MKEHVLSQRKDKEREAKISPKAMNKTELLEKCRTILEVEAVLVPAIFTRGIRIPAFLTLQAPKKISELTNIDVGIAALGDIDINLVAIRKRESQRLRPNNYLEAASN